MKQEGRRPWTAHLRSSSIEHISKHQTLEAEQFFSEKSPENCSIGEIY